MNEYKKKVDDLLKLMIFYSQKNQSSRAYIWVIWEGCYIFLIDIYKRKMKSIPK
ncbi:hypothetical protein JCM21142_114643 [Saccharicrinis fermentans DSM 9555 = JCM 21142]|uniref:Uncharacterized protein n=1 Tax=Saccharicrinis fermentans DSM 9555 = JCM 21142 TaxID=869213 RepID=W7YTW3_9BACT|nr:hypothetical protein JCM21142_114643 [Saccharicrinis fermentans DSM 9555 = JCM 21142]